MSLTNMGIVAIKSHMNNKPHKLESEQQKIKNIFNKKTKDVQSDTPHEAVALLNSPQSIPLKLNPPFYTVS